MTEISLQEYCRQIEDTIEQGRYGEAVAHGKHILTQYPKHVETYQLLGKAMLNSGQGEDAVDMFRRVLSANPEDLVAWIGMSEVHAQRGEFDAAAWCLERAFEQAADNELLEEELRRLYGQRDGVEPQRVQLTRGALARFYLKGDLLSRAINEFRDLLAEHPERTDLAVALAEALWRNEQRLEASEVCQKVLDELPFCIKANLILGEIWTSSGREEGQTYLRRAEALDPENRMAQTLFGAGSPLHPREARVTTLEPSALPAEEQPAWLADAAAAPEAAEGALVDVTSALETQIEIPSWLEDATGEPSLAPPPGEAAAVPPIPAAEPAVEETVPAPAEIPDWLTGAGEEPVEEEPEATIPEEAEPPDWLAGLGLELTGAEETLEPPAELEIEPTGGAEAPVTLGEEETPDWLAELGIAEVSEQAPPPVPPSAPIEEPEPDWLTGIRDQFAEETKVPPETVTEAEAISPEWEEPGWLEDKGEPLGDDSLSWLEQPAEEAIPAPAQIPDWMQELAPSEEAAPSAPVAEEVPAPDWLEGDEMPSGDEALAWLEQLTEGKEDELQAQAQAESEARLAEIMGRPAPPEAPVAEPAPEQAVAPPVEPAVPAPAEIPDWMQELAPSEEAAPSVPLAEEAIPAPAEIPDWMQELAPSEEAAPSAPVAEEVPAPDWLEGDEMPSGDEALAWLEQLTEGKEDELQAQAQAESEARLAEIMGRPAPPEAPVAEPAPEQAVAPPVEPAVPAPAEIPDWMQELAPPDVTLPEAAPPTAEAAPTEAAAPPAEGAFGWIAFDEPETPPQAIAAVEEAMPAAEEIAPMAEEAPTPDWLEGEGVPSGDEALAWLEQLAAGKEEELQAQAQVDVEARMAEIMGRPAPAQAPAEEAPPPEETPPAPEAAAEEIVAPPVEKAPAAMEVVPPVEEFAPPETPEPEYPEEEQVPPAAEISAAEEAPPPEETLAPDMRWEPAVVTPEEVTAPTPVVEEIPGIAEMEVPEPPEKAVEAPEAPIIEPPPPAERFAAERAHLKEHPRDYEARLALARALWQAGERREALEAYTRLIRAGKHLESSIPDLESYLEQWPSVDVQRVLGDAYMKDGRLEEALDLYRRALEKL
jgi:tetratricopeptide (TPR) repeat protein